MRIDAVILDCDGTMFDSERVWWDVWFEVGKKHGVKVSEDFLIMITGATPRKERNIHTDYPEISIISKEVRETGQKIFKKIYQERINIEKPGFAKLMEYLLDNDYSVSVVSNSATSHVHGLIDTTAYADKFAAVICREDVNNGKPDPEGLLKAAAAMNVKPENCLVIEDSKLGTLAAKNAGMPRIYIKDLVPKDEELNSYIEYELNSLDEVVSFLQKETSK